MSYTLCPTLLEKWLKDNFCNSAKVLWQITNSSLWIKLYLDKKWNLLSEYEKIISSGNLDNTTVKIFMEYLIKYLEENNEDLIYPKDIWTISYSNFKELIIKISSETSKQILLNDKIDYNSFSTSWIQLIEPNEFLSGISANINTTNINTINWPVLTWNNWTQR
jgi:hypothetical protein